MALNSSINEVAALTRKAAKGAGFSWSVADEVAFAATWLCRNEIDGAKAIATHLAQIDRHGADALKLESLDRPWRSRSHGLCSVSAGTAFSDLAFELGNPPDDENNPSNPLSGELFNLITPVLFIPFLAHSCHQLAANAASSTDATPAHTYKATVSCAFFNAIIKANQRTSWLQDMQILATEQHQPADLHYQIECDQVESSQLERGTESEISAAPRSVQHRVNIATDTLELLNQLASRTYAPATDASRAGAGAGTSDND